MKRLNSCLILSSLILILIFTPLIIAQIEIGGGFPDSTLPAVRILSPTSSPNYSTVNVNNSQFFQGYTPSTLPVSNATQNALDLKCNSDGTNCTFPVIDVQPIWQNDTEVFINSSYPQIIRLPPDGIFYFSKDNLTYLLYNASTSRLQLWANGVLQQDWGNSTTIYKKATFQDNATFENATEFQGEAVFNANAFFQNMSGEGLLINTNVIVQGYLTASNICYSDGTNCSINGSSGIWTNNSNETYINTNYPQNLLVRENFTVLSNQYVYTASNSPIAYNGIEFYIPGDVATIYIINFSGTLYPTFIIDDGTQNAVIDNLDGTIGNLNMCLGNATQFGGAYVTAFGNIGAVEIQDFVDSLIGSPGVICVDFYPDAWNKTGSAYTFIPPTPTYQVANNSGSTTWVNPPTLIGAQGIATLLTPENTIFNTQNVTFNGDYFKIVNGNLLFGISVVPFLSDFIIQAFRAVVNPTGNVAGFIAGFQDASTADVNYQMWGGNFGNSFYGNANYNSLLHGLTASARLDINDHTANSLAVLESRLALTGGSYPSTESNANNVYMLQLGAANEGANISSYFYNFYGVYDGVDFDWDVNNWYGIYLDAHPTANNSWGVYNLDRTYLEKVVYAGSQSCNILNGTETIGDVCINRDTDIKRNAYVGGNTTLNGNLNQTNGNALINNYYGEMWFHNDSVLNITYIDTQNVFHNISALGGQNQKGGILNGFTYTGGATGTLTAQISGVYLCNYAISETGQNDRLHFALAKNGVIQYNTEQHVKGGAAIDEHTVSGHGLISLAVGDMINLQVENTDGVADVEVNSVNVNCLRIGN